MLVSLLDMIVSILVQMLQELRLAIPNRIQDRRRNFRLLI